MGGNRSDSVTPGQCHWTIGGRIFVRQTTGTGFHFGDDVGPGIFLGAAQSERNDCWDAFGIGDTRYHRG